jgi:hypothetical protein
MKLKDLKTGDYFQFARQGNPAIHMVSNPALGLYTTVGDFHEGYPRQRCCLGNWLCPHQHEQMNTLQEHVERGVKLVHLADIIERFDLKPWSFTTPAEERCDYLAKLQAIDREIAALKKSS